MSINRAIDTLAARKAGLPKTTGSLQPMLRRCGAQLTYTGTSPENPPRYCMRWPARGRRRCAKFHNGDAAVGADVPNFKTGANSRYAYLSPKVFERFAESLADARLLDLKPDIALLDVLKQEAATGLAVGESVAAWQAGRAALAELHRARSKATLRAAIAKLDAAFADAPSAALAREETARAIERRGKLVKTYQQMQVDAEDLIPAKRVGLVMAMLAALVREFILDDQRRREFSARFIGLLGPRLRPGGEPAGDAGPTVRAD